MRRATYFLLLVVIFLGPKLALAANNGELVQAAGDSKVYYIEGVLKRHIADYSTFQNWGFNAAAIKRISRTELNNHPTGPALTRVIQYGGNVYLVENGTRRYVPTAQSLTLYGFSFASLTDVNTDTFYNLPESSTLTTPRAVRVPGDSRVFYLDGGARRPFVSDAVMQDGYGITSDGAPVSSAAASLPIGSTLTNVILYNGNVYYVGGGGKKYHVGTEPTLLYNNLKWEDVRSVTSDVGAALPDGDGPLRPPALIRTSGNDKIWLVDDNGERRWVPSTDVLNQWGYTEADVRTVSNSVAYKWPEVSTLTRFVRHDGLTYYIQNGKRYLIKDSLTERMFGLTADQRIDIGWIGLTHAIFGGDLQSGVETLSGHSISATSGKTAREQHLYLNKAEADLGRTASSATLHYQNSGTPSRSQNGMAGGYGSFGSEASPASVDQERYYITMRWNYCNWYEDSGTLDSGHPTTRCGSYDATSKSWHRHKKVVVTNPDNGRQMILSVEEAGPAIWTGRVSGLSPEAMDEIGASTDDTLTYYWAANQDLALGRIR